MYDLRFEGAVFVQFAVDVHHGAVFAFDLDLFAKFDVRLFDFVYLSLFQFQKRGDEFETSDFFHIDKIQFSVGNIRSGRDLQSAAEHTRVGKRGDERFIFLLYAVDHGGEMRTFIGEQRADKTVEIAYFRLFLQ